MKKLCILLALIMIPASMWALSIENDASFGLFGNEMDAASSVGGGFLELDKTYIFGGLANIDQYRVTGGSGNSAPTVGAFVYGDMPWSVFARISRTDFTQADNTVTYTTPSKTISATESEDWISRKVETNFNNKLADTINDRFQFITVYDGMVVGAFLNVGIDNSSYNPGANYKRITTEYYDKAAAGVAPDPAEDYTITEKQVRKDNSFEHSLSVPVFIPGDDMDKSLSLMLSLEGEDKSQKNSKIYSEAVYSSSSIPATVTDIIQDNTIDKTSSLSIRGSYIQSTKSPFFENDDKDFTVGGSVEISLDSKKGGYVDETQVWDYSTPTARVKSTYDKDIIEASFSPKLSLDATAQASHAFSYELENGAVFKMKPAVNAGFSSSSDENSLKELTFLYKTDTNNDQNLDQIDSDVTITGNNIGLDLSTLFNPGGPTLPQITKTTEFMVGVNPVCAFQFQPDDWKLGFTLGAEANIGLSVINEKQKEGTYTETDVDHSATPNVTSTDYIIEIEGQSTTYFDWTTTASYDFGMNLDVSENVQLQLDLNGAPTAANLFDFNNVVVQALVSLP